MIPLTAGQVAPDFHLKSTAGTDVILSSYRGKAFVLLAFYPAAFTSVCTAEVCAFSDDFDAFAALGVEVLPISVDNVPSLIEYKNKYGMRVELLSDLKREASTAFGTLFKDTFVSNRAYFLIDPTGMIVWAHVEEHPGHRRENAELIAEITKAIKK